MTLFQEPAYTPQVEAISPIIPQEEPPNKILREELLANIDRVDRDMVTVEQQISKLKKKQVRVVGILREKVNFNPYYLLFLYSIFQKLDSPIRT